MLFKVAITYYYTINNYHLWHIQINHVKGESIKMDFDVSIKLEFYDVRRWSLRSFLVKLIEIEANIVRQSRLYYVSNG